MEWVCWEKGGGGPMYFCFWSGFVGRRVGVGPCIFVFGVGLLGEGWGWAHVFCFWSGFVGRRVGVGPCICPFSNWASSASCDHNVLKSAHFELYQPLSETTCDTSTVINMRKLLNYQEHFYESPGGAGGRITKPYRHAFECLNKLHTNYSCSPSPPTGPSMHFQVYV